jgi:hypothetical protein
VAGVDYSPGRDMSLYAPIQPLQFDVTRIDPDEKPKQEQEKGSILDYTAGDLVFSYPQGLPYDAGLVYDYREPTVGQLQEMLDNDGKARSLEAVMASPIVGAGWHIEPGTGNPDHKTAQWVEEVLRRDTPSGGMKTPMETIISQMTSAFVMRRSYHEKVWKQDDNGDLVYDKVAWRPANTCIMIRQKRTGDLLGFSQWLLGMPSLVNIVVPYALVYVHGQGRNPVKGISDLQVAYRNYRTKEKLMFLWHTYCETMSLPRTVVLANGDTAAKKAASTIAALKNAGVAGIPKEWVTSIQPLPVSSEGGGAFQEAIAYLDQQSALSLLAGFTDLPGRAMGTGTGMGTGTRGSYGMSQSQIEFFMQMLNAYRIEMNVAMTNQLVTDLVRYNKGKNVQVPQFAIGPLEEADVNQAYQLLESIVASPSVNVPTEFIEELTLLVADELGINTDVIEEAYENFTPMSQNQQVAAKANIGAEVAQKATTAKKTGVDPRDVPTGASGAA